MRDWRKPRQLCGRMTPRHKLWGVGYIFALGIVFQLDAVVPNATQVGVVKIFAAWLVIVVPILLFGFVLYPTRKSAPHLADEMIVDIEQVLYVVPSRHRNVRTLIEAVDRADPANEIAFELLKVSALRELKRQRFLRALFSAGVCFAVLFASQLSRSIGLPF